MCDLCGRMYGIYREWDARDVLPCIPHVCSAYLIQLLHREIALPAQAVYQVNMWQTVLHEKKIPSFNVNRVNKVRCIEPIYTDNLY